MLHINSDFLDDEDLTCKSPRHNGVYGLSYSAKLRSTRINHTGFEKYYGIYSWTRHFSDLTFDWPQPFEPIHRQDAKELHAHLERASWIKDVLTANGGQGGKQSSMWEFWRENFAALDRRFKDHENEIAQAYHRFFTAMNNVQDQIREEVIFN